MAEVAVAVAEDDTMQCSKHPLKSTSPNGGICALCLQQKLGQLVTSSTSSFLPHVATTESQSQSEPSAASATRVPFLSTPNHPPPHYPLKRSHSTSATVATPKRRGFWSFLQLSNKKPFTVDNIGTSNPASFAAKVTRSKSVGCGSRSFSGFADCQRNRHSTSTAASMRDRVLCGGLFGGFIMITSSSSSASTADENNNNNNNNTPVPNATPNGRSRSWAWPLPSPRRAFAGSTKPATTTTTTTTATTSKATNLADIPSLLSVRG